MKLFGFLIISLSIHSSFAKSRRLANNFNKEENGDVSLIKGAKCLYNGKNMISKELNILILQS